MYVIRRTLKLHWGVGDGQTPSPQNLSPPPAPAPLPLTHPPPPPPPEHLTAIRAWCEQCLPGRRNPDVAPSFPSPSGCEGLRPYDYGRARHKYTPHTHPRTSHPAPLPAPPLPPTPDLSGEGSRLRYSHRARRPRGRVGLSPAPPRGTAFLGWYRAGLPGTHPQSRGVSRRGIRGNNGGRGKAEVYFGGAGGVAACHSRGQRRRRFGGGGTGALCCGEGQSVKAGDLCEGWCGVVWCGGLACTRYRFGRKFKDRLWCICKY